MRWLVFAGLLLTAPPARAEDAHAEMARSLEAAADVEPAPAALPTVSPVAQARETRARPDASKAAAKASAAANGRAMAAALARAARAASEAASAASDRAAKVRAHGREHPARGVDR